MNGIMNPPTALLHPQRSPLRLAHESTLWNLLGDLRGQHHVTILVHVVVVALTVLNPVRSHVCRCGGRRNARERERFEETRSLRLCETVIHGARRHRPGTRSRQEMSRRCPGPDSQTGKGLAGVGEANWLKTYRFFCLFAPCPQRHRYLFCFHTTFPHVERRCSS